MLSSVLQVKVDNGSDVGVAGESVTWSTTGGTLSGSSSTTDENGLAQITFTLGATETTYTVTATHAASNSSVNFSQTANYCNGSRLIGSAFLKGDGTSGDPYYICNADQFNSIGDDATLVTKSFRLGKDLDLTAAGTTPIGSPANPFIGNFDGNDHTISGISLTATANEYGLFRSAGTMNVFGSQATSISDLSVGITTINAAGYDDIGGLVGRASDEVTLSNCHTRGGSITNGGTHVGGLVGRALTQDAVGGSDLGTGDLISASSSTTNVAGNTYVGGLVGSINVYSKIVKSYSTAQTITGAGVTPNTLGALIGNSGAVVKCSYTDSTVGSSSIDVVGGFAGIYGGGSINYSYSLATVVANDYVSGMIANWNASGTANQVYFAGSISHSGGASWLGGLADAFFSGTITAGVWDTDVSGIATSGGGTGYTTAQLHTTSTGVGSPYNGWNTSVWEFSNSGYPTLKSPFPAACDP